jgi:hypothetical protein
MSQQQKKPIPEQQAEQDGNTERPTPRTDSTNPMRQESVGIFVPAEECKEKPNEPGA